MKACDEWTWRSIFAAMSGSAFGSTVAIDRRGRAEARAFRNSSMSSRRALARRAGRQKFAEGRKGFRRHGLDSDTDHADTFLALADGR